MNPSAQCVVVEVRNDVCWITINRPELRNAINEDVIAGISSGLTLAGSTPDVRAVVLTGAGERAFCAGADLRPNSNIFDFDFSQPRTDYADLLRQAVAFDIPLIARVNGACMAGGMGLLTMCDMAVASTKAQFGLPEVKVGMFPMQVASVMQHLIPRRKFAEMCITGEPLSAQEALDIGLVNYVVEPTELDGKVDWLLGRITDKSPTAIRRGKNALRAIADMTFAQSIAFMEAQLGSLRMTADAAEGLAAFAEKRRPAWTGK
ncbi:enoyl-CoA hydratase/isomerase family protein [Cupriavidus sp. DF5525]|uniref:enoyl-CoA hydratase/isomerase family protein n=1 Tax=Cupriavidus sp. DF5525 TaxID=3160989 RepID=UPI0032DFDEE6